MKIEVKAENKKLVDSNAITLKTLNKNTNIISKVTDEMIGVFITSLKTKSFIKLSPI